MTCANARTAVAMEIFLAQNVVTPVGVRLELLGAPKNRSKTFLILPINPNQTVGNLSGDLRNHAVPPAISNSHQRDRSEARPADIETLYSRPCTEKTYGCSLCERQRERNSVRTQETLLAKHAGWHSPEPLFIQNGQQPTALNTSWTVG